MPQPAKRNALSTKKENSHTPERERIKKALLQGGNVLTAPEREGFIRRWINDKGGGMHLQNKQALGWEFVCGDPEIDADGHVGRATQQGSAISRIVDDAAGTKSYLMEIPEETFAIIKEIKKEKNDKIMLTQANEKERLSSATGGEFFGDQGDTKGKGIVITDTKNKVPARS